MKILAIRGKNLASIEGAFEIDFAAEPLRSAGIFAITGSTGAGKSTLLDALCLALFDDTPRTSNAGEKLSVVDVKEHTISQGDPRNLLRRGTVGGYAEVDFVALDGDSYRSRWMVRRARDKATGSLQATEMQLTNLSTGREISGRKTELLPRVSELIGLTFSQFTRSVLLAQGDFATFLKAKQNEKAELLEKLTGTEVYSRISMAVYKRAQEAQEILDRLRVRMKDIRLLTPEELEVYRIEKESREVELKSLNAAFRLAQDKLAWYKQRASLAESLGEAGQLLERTYEALKAFAPRKIYLERIDTAQEIRDVYSLLEAKRKQREMNQSALFDLMTKEKDCSIFWENIGTELTDARIALEKCELHYDRMKPEIERAKVLDTKCQEADENVKKAENESEAQKRFWEDTARRIAGMEKGLAEWEEKQGQVTRWFEEQAAYKEMVPRIDVSLSLLEDWSKANGRIAKARKEQVAEAGLREGYQAREALLQAELEKLNRQLPTEVLTLRGRLTEGTPCPVCGSIHHPVFASGFEGFGQLQEADLEEAKKRTAEELEKVGKDLKTSEQILTGLQTVIQTHGKNLEETEVRLDSILSPLPDWREKATEGTLAKTLADFAVLWTTNQQLADRCATSIGQFMASLESERPHLQTASEQLQMRTEQLQAAKDALKSLHEERQLLLQGKEAAAVVAYFEKQRKEYQLQLDNLKAKKDALEKERAEAAGKHARLEEEQKGLGEEIARLQQALAIWMEGHDGAYSIEQLSELFGRERSWILHEKEALKVLEDQAISYAAKVKEREAKVTEWEMAPNRPLPEETAGSLQESLAATEEKVSLANERLTVIRVELANHEAGKKKMAAFEKELKEKEEVASDWAKLNDLFGSANGSKFKRIAQSYTLDALLVYANKQLEQVSKRYLIRRIPDSLGLEVVDREFLNDVRTVHSLSGGESFLVSLALALGLSSLSSNRMKIESLFIDEGFGSLDMETLNTVMEALETLHTQGRKIGVISHVTEMTERIPVQIAVIRTGNSRSRVEVKRFGKGAGL